MASRTLKLEAATAFSALDVMVARDEGLFEAEGLDVEFVAYQPQEMGSQDGTFENPVTIQGSLVDRGEAHMFQG